MKHKSALKRVLSYLKGSRLIFLASLFSAFFSVVLTLYAPVLTGEAIDCVLEKGKVDFDTLFQILFRFVLVIALTAVFQWLMSLCNNRIAYRAVMDIRKDAFEHIQELPLSYLDSHPHGDIVSRLIADIDQLSDGLLMGFTQLFTGVMTILGTLLFMLSVNGKITLVVVLVTPVSFFAAAFIAKKTHRMFRLSSETRGELTGLIDEFVGNQKLVRAFGYESEAQGSFDSVNEKLQEHSLRATFFSSLTNPVTRFVNGLVYAGVCIAGAFSVIRGGLSVGQLSCFLSYANQYTKPFNEISGVVTELQNALACAGRVFAFMDEKPMEHQSGKEEKIVQAEGQVNLENVSFSYVKDRELIRDLNLDVHPGQRIAIVGPTGCGKSTLINLLMRFYETDKGRICVDGKNIRSLTRENLREQYGMVLQETWLKTASVRENIAYGKPEASEEEIVEAAKASYAHSFIKRLPQGYDTILTEDGGLLSQGQKQLLCIARVMLCLPPMLILDEATSSIDTRTEQKVQNAFARMMEGRTSFIVAHRLSTIREADRILVMKSGKIVEQGTHEELLEKQGFYAQLYNSQWEMPDEPEGKKRNETPEGHFA